MTNSIEQHALRPQILAEIHARPYAPISTPCAVLQQAFLCKPSSCAQADMELFAAWCVANSVEPPSENSRHHVAQLDKVRLTWERHTEFITLTWDCPYNKSAQEQLWQLSEKHLPQIIGDNYALISAARVNLLKGKGASKTINKKPNLSDYDLSDFDTDNICMSLVKNDRALIAADFKQDEFGATKFTVFNAGLDPRNSGILVRRILELETYRVMSLYGYERVKRVLSEIAEVEQQLVRLISQINNTNDLAATRKALDEITEIAAGLAHVSAVSQYRFSATRAYYSLVQARLKRINEQNISGYPKIEEFLAKRLWPAMRTCENVENRIAIAGDKLDRSTGLLRTKVDIQMQEQSHEILASMNERALMQYRLQTTVEGLSIAAVSYYVVGLLSYLAKGAGIDAYISPTKLTAIFVPVAVLTVWYLVRRIRAKHK